MLPPMHGMPVRGDESSDDGFRQGPSNMPVLRIIGSIPDGGPRLPIIVPVTAFKSLGFN